MSKITSLFNLTPKRYISLTAPCDGKRNFKKFMIINKRGTRLHKQAQRENPLLPVDKRGVRDVGFQRDGRFVTIPEMIPELVIPDLTDCKLKPYVSYKADDVVQTEFTSQQLFNAIYSEKIVNDFKSRQLNEDGEPLAPSAEESLTPEEARLRARKTGSDIFTPPEEEELRV